MKTRLVLVEGLCGAGKTTLSKMLHGYLLESGHAALYFYEGAPNHPATRFNTREFVQSSTHIPAEEYTDTAVDDWGKFADEAARGDTIYVFEGVFMQHPVHDHMRIYHSDAGKIINHIKRAAEKLTILNPILFYLAIDDLPSHLRWVADIRISPKYASDEYLTFFEKRKVIETVISDSLPFPAHRVATNHSDWNGVYKQMVGIMGDNL